MNKPFYKKWWFILIAALIVIYGLSALTLLGDEEETTNKSTVEEKEVKAEKPKENTETTEEKKSKEIEFYKNELSPKIDAVQSEYDRIWDEQWAATFNGISDGSVDIYTAYKNMTFIETNYGVLEDEISKLNGKGLSKKNKKHLEEFKTKLKKASSYRALAASDAAKMFDNGDFKPSEMTSIESIVSTGDVEMLSAIMSRLSIEQDLGLADETE